MRVYISGPMTGYEDHNFPAFNRAADELYEQGYLPANPADTGVIEGYEWSDYMRFDIRLLTYCDAIYTLPGWERSRGALLEMQVATALGLEWINSPAV